VAPGQTMVRFAACGRILAALLLATPAQGLAQPPAAPPAAAPAPASSAPLPVDAFAQIPFLSSPLLSPDGRRIAARLLVGGDEKIGIWTLSAPRDDPPRLIDAGNLDGFSWAGDDRLLLSSTGLVMLAFQGVILPLPMRRIMVADVATGAARALGESQGLFDNLVFVDPDGRYVLLSGQADSNRPPSVYRIDLETNQSVEVQPGRPGVWSWFADANGVVRVGVDYGERRTRIYYRATPDAPLTRVVTRRDFGDDSVIDMVRFIAGSDRGVMITNAETGRFALYEYDFATDTRGAALFEHPEVDVESAVFAADGSVDGIVYEDDRPRTRWLNPDMARLQAQLDSTFRGKTNTIVNRSRDGNRVLVFSASADDPGTYYVFDRAARRMEIFASPYDRLQGHSFAPVRPVSYQSRDGLAIRGYLTVPAGRPERGLPLVVLPHGGPFLRASWAFDPEVQFLASRGYAVLQPNFRGSTGYGRAFVERGYGQLGGGMIDDIDDGVDWLVGEGIVDASRVCIMGSSYGGYAATWAAMRSPQRYRCAISWAGPSDLNAMLRYDSRFLAAPRYRRDRRLQLRGEQRADLNAVSPLRNPERLSVPVLIGHGANDIRVPVDQSRDLVRALERRRASVESVFYPKAGHNFSTPEESADFMRRVEAFLARHNPAGGSAPGAPAGLPISPPSR
jgi:dipeptidyl aminopeptidase/acylaminoacyl peptidase